MIGWIALVYITGFAIAFLVSISLIKDWSRRGNKIDDEDMTMLWTSAFLWPVVLPTFAVIYINEIVKRKLKESK